MTKYNQTKKELRELIVKFGLFDGKKNFIPYAKEAINVLNNAGAKIKTDETNINASVRFLTAFFQNKKQPRFIKGPQKLAAIAIAPYLTYGILARTRGADIEVQKQATEAECDEIERLINDIVRQINDIMDEYQRCLESTISGGGPFSPPPPESPMPPPTLLDQPLDSIFGGATFQNNPSGFPGGPSQGDFPENFPEGDPDNPLGDSNNPFQNDPFPDPFPDDFPESFPDDFPSDFPTSDNPLDPDPMDSAFLQCSSIMNGLSKHQGNIDMLERAWDAGGCK